MGCALLCVTKPDGFSHLHQPRCDADVSQQKTPLRHTEPGFPLLFSKAMLAGDFVMIRDHKKSSL